MKSTVFGFLVVSLVVAPGSAWADSASPLWPTARTHDPLRVCWLEPCAQAPASRAADAPRLPAVLPVIAPDADDDPQSSPPPPRAIEYSDAYRTRLKIHKYASFATLPLFAGEYALGQSMFNNTPADSSSKRGVHAALGAGIMGLFAVNTVTGAWNLFGEGRKDPHGRTLRLVHGLLMMVADAGFVATSLSGPNSRHQSGAQTYESQKVTHRNLAVFSVSVGTGGYLLMLFGNR